MRAKKAAADEANRAVASRPKSSAKGNEDRKGNKGRRKGEANGEKGSLGGKGQDGATQPQGSVGSKGKATGVSEEGPKNVYAQPKGSLGGKGKGAASGEGPKNVYAQPRGPLEGKGKGSKGASARPGHFPGLAAADMPALSGAKGGTSPGASAGAWGKGSAAGGPGARSSQPQEATVTRPAVDIPAVAKTPAPAVQAPKPPVVCPEDIPDSWDD